MSRSEGVGMELENVKLPVSFETLKDRLQEYLVDVEKTGDNTISGTWVHDGKVYENVRIPIHLIFTPLDLEGGTNDLNVYYEVWCEIRGVNEIMQQMSGILSESELVDLKTDMFHMDSHHQVECITFYNLEII